ncbi:hypothetical protein [Acidithiobacillus sp. AMEEHan]|nr:hypothetical protein [Acidithiobacillus sp. AMEEHan]
MAKPQPLELCDLHRKANTPTAYCRVPGEIGPGSAKDISLFWQ